MAMRNDSGQTRWSYKRGPVEELKSSDELTLVLIQCRNDEEY